MVRHVTLASVLAFALALAGCPLPVSKQVQIIDVSGTVVDANTGAPIPNALIVQTIARAGFWTLPATYDLGQTTTGADGRFTIRADPHRVGNVADPDSKPNIMVFARGYTIGGYLHYRSNLGEARLTPVTPHRASDPCTGMNFSEDTCARIRAYMDWRP